MPMKVVGTYRLDEFCLKHPLTRTWVRAWLAECKAATWSSPVDIKQRYQKASFLQGNLVIFDVKGNDYRLVTQVAYQAGVIVVKWIGNHQAYNGINWEQTSNETRSN